MRTLLDTLVVIFSQNLIAYINFFPKKRNHFFETLSKKKCRELLLTKTQQIVSNIIFCSMF